MTATHLLGIDLGTSGVKALLLPIEGGVDESLSATVGLTHQTPHPGWSEQDPHAWWEAVVEAIRQVLARSGLPATAIAGVASAGQMHGATLLDTEGEVLRPCILWNDSRSGAECAWITETVGAERLLHAVGNPARVGFTGPSIVWVRNHEPDVYQRIATVFLPKDYITFRLTGVRVTEYSDASGTLLFDVVNRRWSDEVASSIGISPDILPPAHPSTAVVGTVSAGAARETGLIAGTPVVAGAADNPGSAIGNGVVRTGQVLASLGTSGTIVAPSTSPAVDPGGRLATFCHAVPDTWYLMGVILSAGGSLRWFRDNAAILAPGVEGDPYDALMDAASSVPPGSEGLIFLPYLTGERTPHGDPNARGAFIGLSLRHTNAHLARSVVEGVSFAFADSADLMRNLGIDLTSVRATGGGARSPLWRQLLADVIGSRVLTASSDLGPAFGAAIIAGAGIGAFDSIPAATERLVAIAAESTPNDTCTATYREYHQIYDSLYPALHPTYDNLSNLVARTRRR